MHLLYCLFHSMVFVFCISRILNTFFFSYFSHCCIAPYSLLLMFSSLSSSLLLLSFICFLYLCLTKNAVVHSLYFFPKLWYYLSSIVFFACIAFVCMFCFLFLSLSFFIFCYFFRSISLH